MERVTVKTGDFTMEAARFGSGKRTMVILPGVSVMPVIDSAAAVEAGFSRFGEEYTVWLFDRKLDIREGYGVPEMAADTAAAMKELGISRAYLYCASQGAMMGQLICAGHPELVEKAVFASTIVRQNETSREVFGSWVRLSAEGDVRALNRHVFSHVYSETYRQTFREEFASMEELGTPELVRRFGVLAQACLDFDGTEAAPRISCPVLAVGSEGDRVMTAAGTRELGTLPFCETFLYEGYGHACYDEAPDFQDRMEAFFR